MITYYFISAYRNLLSNRKFSFINIIGFSFAISVCLAISLFIAHELSYDRYNVNEENIIRIIDERNNSSLIDYRVKDILKSNYPEIKNSCLVLRSGHSIEVRSKDEGFYLDDIMSVDNHFFEMFTINFKAGNSINTFPDLNSAVITETIATKLFGDDNPLGKELFVWGSIPVIVRGVIKDFPGNSSIQAGLLVNAENENFKFYRHIGNSDDLSSYRWLFQIYLQLKNENEQGHLLSKINENINLVSPYAEKLGFIKLKDLYLHDSTTGSETKKGNPDLLRLLTGIGLIILALAIINYINLTVARQNKRYREAGIKKAFGACRKEIILSFLFESALVSIIALILGFYTVWMLLPFYNGIFDAELDLSKLLKLHVVIAIMFSVILIGAVSGSGPAVMYSAISPVKVLSGTMISPGKKNYLRNILVIFQFSVSIILIFCVIIVQRQIKYVKNMNPGFKEEQLLRLDLPNIRENDVQKAMTLIDEYRKLPLIKSVSVSRGIPGEIRMSMGSNIENSTKNMSVPCILADTAFLRTFDLKVVKGRSLQPGDYGKVCMFNEAAYRHFEFEDLVEKKFNNFGGFDIVGVVNDFQFTSLHKVIGPVCIMFTPDITPSSMSIRFSQGSTVKGMETIRSLWDEMLPGYPFNYQFYDDWFDSLYRSEERFARTISLFAVLAIVISSIGILGLSIFSSEQKTKEIGIRKVNGGTISEIIILLNKEYLIWLIIAFLIGLPLMTVLMRNWLSSFAYRTALDWWIFVISGLSAFLIALLAVSWQSWRAATRNPVEALRYE